MSEAGPADTLAKLLVEQATRRGSAPAIRDKRRGIWHTTTWRELSGHAAGIAAALQAAGVTRGGCVAMLGDHTPHLQAALAATHAIGAVALPLYPFATADELHGPLQAAGAAIVFAENQEQVDKLLEIAARLPALKRIVFDEDRGMHHYGHSQLIDFTAFLNTGHKLHEAEPQKFAQAVERTSPDDTAFLFLSPGASGEPRLVPLTNRSLMQRAAAAVSADRLTANDVTMAYLPPGWIAQMQVSYVQALLTGYCVCCPESIDTTLGDIREIAPTYLVATPRVLEAIRASVTHRVESAGGLNLSLFKSGMAAAVRSAETAMGRGGAGFGDRLARIAYGPLLYAPIRDAVGLNRIRAAYCAGDLAERSLLMFFRSLGVNFKLLYGTTDTGYFVAMHADEAVDPGTVGRAADGIEIEIAGDGEIMVRSGGSEQWFATGDVGQFNSAGQLVVTDRKRDIGNLADGTPFAPRQIENRIKSIPLVKEAVAFGDGRAFVAALIDIDMEAASRLADAREANYTGRAELAALDLVADAVAEAIARVNAEIAAQPGMASLQVRRIALLQAELAPHTGALTRIGTLRRDAIDKTYRDVVAAFYDGRATVALAELSEEEGHQNEVERHQLKITDVPVAAGAARTAA